MDSTAPAETAAEPVVEGSTPDADRPALRLTELAGGAWARLVRVDDRRQEALLRALGLGVRRRFQLCKAGSPWILRVRSTRIGLTDEVASTLVVEPEAAETPR